MGAIISQAVSAHYKLQALSFDLIWLLDIFDNKRYLRIQSKLISSSQSGIKNEIWKAVFGPKTDVLSVFSN